MSNAIVLCFYFLLIVVLQILLKPPVGTQELLHLLRQKTTTTTKALIPVVTTHLLTLNLKKTSFLRMESQKKNSKASKKILLCLLAVFPRLPGRQFASTLMMLTLWFSQLVQLLSVSQILLRQGGGQPPGCFLTKCINTILRIIPRGS